MEGSEANTPAVSTAARHVERTVVAWDVLRFLSGLVFILLGGGLLLEGAAGSRLFLDGVNRVFEFYTGLMSVALGGLLISGMSKHHAGE